MKSDGFFAVIEGPDASGKETQTGKLVQWLRDQDISEIDFVQQQKIIGRMPGNYPDPEAEKVEDSVKNGVWRLSFPTYSQTPGGRVVEAYLSGRLGERSDLSTMDKVDIYAADRKQFKEQIRMFLDEGGIIVCDRYREANLIHQLVGLDEEEWREKLKQIKAVDTDLPDPDIVFYLDVSVEEAQSRMRDREKDIHELDTDYMRDSNLNGREVADYEGWTVIDADRTPDKVSEHLEASIEDRLLER